jgi:hypothetical protein
VSTHIPLQQLCPVGQSPCVPQVQEPLTHVSLEAHACPHCPQLFVSLWVSVQLLLQQSLESQQKPPQHRPEQQVFTVHAPPAGVQGGSAHLRCGLQYPLQQSLFLLHPRPLRWHLGSLFPKAVPMLVRPSSPPIDAVTMTFSAWRRDLELARALVSSSKLVGSTLVRSSGGRLRRRAQRVNLFSSRFSDTYDLFRGRSYPRSRSACREPARSASLAKPATRNTTQRGSRAKKSSRLIPIARWARSSRGFCLSRRSPRAGRRLGVSQHILTGEIASKRMRLALDLSGPVKIC